MPRQGVPKLHPGCDRAAETAGRAARGGCGGPCVQLGRAGGRGVGLSVGKHKWWPPDLPILLRRPSEPKSCFVADGRASNVQSGEKLFFTLIALELAE